MSPRPLVLALDLGATRIRAAAVDASGRLAARHEGLTPITAGQEAIVEGCRVALEAVLGDLAPADRRRLAGLGVSAPGPLDPRSGTLLEPPNLGPAGRDLPLGGRLREALGLDVAVERDTHVAALAEQAFGAARGVPDFVYLTVSTGIGGAIVSDGHLFGGPDGLAGELGHLSVDVDGPACGCGGRGHLEAVSSGSGIARTARALIAAGTAPGLARRAAAAGPGGLDARAVAEAEADGDPDAAAIMERARAAFAAAAVSIVDVFAPRLIVVGGSLAAGQGERLLSPARDRIVAEAFRTAAARVAIVPAALSDDVGLVGAVPLLAARGLIPAPVAIRS